MTTVEHALPVSVLHDDVLTLYALSGTGATPTHIVNYGGAMGEQLIWANHDLPNDPKCVSCCSLSAFLNATIYFRVQVKTLYET